MAKASLQIRLLSKYPSVTDDNRFAFFGTLRVLLCPNNDFAQFAPKLLEVSERLFLSFGYRIMKSSHVLAIFLGHTYAFFEQICKNNVHLTFLGQITWVGQPKQSIFWVVSALGNVIF